MTISPDSYYDYNPSTGAAIAFAVLYAATFGYTTFQYFWFKCWFWLFMILAATMEAVGYIGRVYSVYNQNNKAAYILQFALIFLAPALMAASCYMAMGRVILHAIPPSSRSMKTLWVAPRWLTPIFVTCDIAAFLIQVFGAGSSASKDPKKIQDGYNIMKIGLIIQLVCFGFFLVVSARFWFVCRRFKDSWPDVAWKKLLMAINFASSLIFIRSVYRMIEFTQGDDGYLLTHEWNFYVFEAVLMLPVFIMFNVYHPSKYLSNVGWKQNRESHLPTVEASLQDIHLNK